MRASTVTRVVPLNEAISLAKSNAKAKFDETIEISMNLGIDPRHADQMVRGLVGLPNGTGKTVRVGVFARGPKADEAQAAGADVVGADDLADEVQEGKIEFDRCIATPDMMGLVGRLGKILGPRGLMPNPRLGTVTMDVKGAVTAAKAGQVEFRAEKAGIVHAGIGKACFEDASCWKTPAPSSTRSEGQADRRQGHLREEGRRQLHDGAGCGGRGSRPPPIRSNESAGLGPASSDGGGQGRSSALPEPVRDRSAAFGL